MTLATDIADDMSFMDGYTAMTLGPRNPTASDDAGYGIAGPLSQRQIALYGGMGLGPKDLSVTLHASTFAVTPKDNDKLTIGSDVYTLLAVEALVLNTTYRAIARKES